ncbi:MAG TPA: potassium-transporting ATPase subunit KdpC [Candidatus Sulfotelmatobacter sp.]|jgi:K+-transporting ATPase ATPase C chain|nr:potassium-transporting ATPase subunit KdpC [Candidatus Sulfotelmatobacter sp.]
MLKELRPSLMLLVVMTIVTGLAYPFAVTSVAQVAFPWQAAGSLIEKNGQVVGSALIGQSFSKPGYFWSRPSATNAPDPNDATKTVDAPYNASNSMASNLAPSAKALADTVAARADTLKAADPDQSDPIPADLLTASGSGLDPDISPDAAYWQARRVASVRHIAEADLRKLIAAQVQGRSLGVLGEPRVNVLKLNMALDEKWPMP